MKYTTFAYLLMLSILAALCSSFDGCQEKVEKQLIGCWTDSYEENSLNTQEQMFRPCDYKTFPPSRFRFSIDLKRDGMCSYLELSPTDGHYMKDGTWRFDTSSKSIEILNFQQEKVNTFNVIKSQNDLLVLKSM